MNPAATRAASTATRSLMSNTPLWQISVRAKPPLDEPVAALLERLFGVPPSTYVDQATGHAEVSVFLDKPTAAPATLVQSLKEAVYQLQRETATPGRPRIQCQRLKAEDWSESWKRHFRPIRVGSTLLVQAGWHQTKPRPSQAVVTLDPGLAFGTGQHPTTLFCLKQIVRLKPGPEPRSFLDVGTGSGILAMAAAKLGFKPIQALDYDPVCVEVALANARRNRVQHKIAIQHGDVLRLPVKRAERFDLICANLIYDVLIAAAHRLAVRVKPGGTLVLAGILKHQFPAVIRTYRALGFVSEETETLKEWRSAALRKATLN